MLEEISRTDGPEDAKELFTEVALADEFVEFLTLPAYDRLMTDSTKADEIALVLEEAIVSGELEPGRVLRQEELSERFDVSRTPVREALRRLAALGLVSFVPNRGVRVRTITLEELREAFLVRAELESLATEIAAPKFTAADLEELERAEEAFSKATQALRARPREDDDRWRLTHDWVTANHGFHDAIYRVAAMPLIERLAKSARRSFSGHAIWAPGGSETDALYERNDNEHRAIIAALRAGNAPGAKALARDHVLHSFELLAHVLEQFCERRSATGGKQASSPGTSTMPGESGRLAGEAHDEERGQPKAPAAGERRDDREGRNSRRRRDEDGCGRDPGPSRRPVEEPGQRAAAGAAIVAGSTRRRFGLPRRSSSLPIIRPAAAATASASSTADRRCWVAAETIRASSTETNGTKPARSASRKISADENELGHPRFASASRRAGLEPLRVELGEALGLVVELGAGTPFGQPAERLDLHPPLLVAPRAGDLAVDEERVHGVGGPRVEDAWAVALREDPRAPRVDEQRRVPHRQEAHRSRRVRVGQRGAREVDELLALLVLEPPQLESARAPASIVRHVQTRPSRRSRAGRAGPKPAR